MSLSGPAWKIQSSTLSFAACLAKTSYLRSSLSGVNPCARIQTVSLVRTSLSSLKKKKSSLLAMQIISVVGRAISCLSTTNPAVTLGTSPPTVAISLTLGPAPESSITLQPHCTLTSRDSYTHQMFLSICTIISQTDNPPSHVTINGLAHSSPPIAHHTPSILATLSVCASYTPPLPIISIHSHFNSFSPV